MRKTERIGDDMDEDLGNMIAIAWWTRDVQEVRPDLTDEQANEVLYMCEHRHDASIGINWDVIIHTAEFMFPEENQNARSI